MKKLLKNKNNPIAAFAKPRQQAGLFAGGKGPRARGRKYPNFFVLKIRQKTCKN